MLKEFQNIWIRHTTLYQWLKLLVVLCLQHCKRYRFWQQSSSNFQHDSIPTPSPSFKLCIFSLTNHYLWWLWLVYECEMCMLNKLNKQSAYEWVPDVRNTFAAMCYTCGKANGKTYCIRIVLRIDTQSGNQVHKYPFSSISARLHSNAFWNTM